MSESNKRIIEAFEKGYRANERGEVISMTGKNLKLSKASNGYLVFGFRTKTGESKVVYVHRFVAYQKYKDELFEAQCVMHADSNRMNNSYENIVIGSLKQNYHDNNDNWKREFALKGAKVKRKLDEKQVREIRILLSEGKSLSFVSKKYGVSKTTIQQIKEGKTYTWIT